MKKRFFGLALATLLCATTLNGFAFADMEGDAFAWAKEAVGEMTQLNIIKGYEDGTFKPDKSVSKQEALVLISRICGYSEESSKKYIELAKAEFGEMLEDYETPYKDEIAYLLHRGVINKKDISSYVADSVAPVALKRYEAAVLLTKLMGAEEEASEKEKFDMQFADINEIPGVAKGYVDYVCSNSIMNGMGDNMFVPMGDVTRAQIATLLYRVMHNIKFNYISGTVSAYESDTYNLIIVDEKGEKQNITVKDGVAIRLDGKETEMDLVPPGSEIRLTYSDKTLVFAECISSEYEDTVEGIFVKYEKVFDETVIRIKDTETKEAKAYTLAKNASIVRKGKSVTVSDIKNEDYIRIDIVNGKASYIYAEEKMDEYTGKVDRIELEPEFGLYVDIAGDVMLFRVVSAPEVKRNGKKATLADVMAGDSVTITTEYGIVTEIVASSKVTKTTGFLQEITISNTPSVVVKSNDVLTEYEVLRTVEITRDGEKATMYDLRIGDSVSVTIEGTTVTQIQLTSVVVNSSATGVVTYINSSYGYIKLDGVNELVFTNKAKVQDKSGKALSLRDIKEGATLTVFGTQTPGSFEATLLVIIE